MHGNLLGEALQRVLSLKLLQFLRGVLVEELVNGEETAADTNLDVVLLDLDHDLLGAELVHASRLPHEHDLELGALRIVVDVLSKALVSGILSHGDVDSDSLLQVDDVLLQRLDLNLSVLELLKQLQRGLVGLVDLLLEREDVVGGLLELAADLGVSLLEVLDGQVGRGKLSLDVLLLGDDLLEADDDGGQLAHLRRQRVDLDLLLVDLDLRGVSQLLELVFEMGNSLVLLNPHLNRN